MAAHLTKPVSQTELFEAISTRFGHVRAATGFGRAGHAVKPYRKVRRKLRLLLAEDNAVNQKIASRVLEKQGHHVTVAKDGREALAR